MASSLTSRFLNTGKNAGKEKKDKKRKAWKLDSKKLLTGLALAAGFANAWQTPIDGKALGLWKDAKEKEEDPRPKNPDQDPPEDEENGKGNGKGNGKKEDKKQALKIRNKGYKRTYYG